MKEALRVNYKKAYGRILIVLGILFTLLFLIGFFLADVWESLAYSVLSSVMIIGGYGISTGPYIVYDHENIILYTYGLRVRKHLQFNDKTAIEVRGEKVYYEGKKVQINDWFLNPSEWNRFISFYSGDDSSLLAELKD